ncbi:adenosylcobinamide-GDP ribazoletransferase [Rhizobium sp. SAFR-030]|uniref:adenosylcobinamide-GDP ribazoletransferase n=1 Tax=Rhizobium sp. SAFR-030 TaxID=3387277 RepID=UPI003F7E23B3
MPNATEFCKDLARSLAFLSRLPMPSRAFVGHDGSMARSCRAFPLAGFVAALGPAVLLYAASGPATGLLAAFLSLAALTLVTGALHEDGLADCADGLFGGRDRAHALSIMKDSRVGSYGVVALILSFGLRASALMAIAATAGTGLAAAALLAAAAFSRALMVWHWADLPLARTDGTAAGAGRPLAAAMRFALGLGAALSLVLLPAGAPLVPVVLALLAAGLAALLFTRFVSRSIGGHTGDTIGATQQITETTLLCALAVLL